MLACPLCRLNLGDDETTCPRDGQEGVPARQGEVPAVVRARFSIVQPFAQGDSGDLYLADDQQTGRRGLLKLLHLPANVTPAEKARLKRELVKQATLASPSLSVPLATGDANGVPWLFREWYEGVSLRVKLTRGGALAVPEALTIASQVAAALDELHRSGMLHRDVKPGHVLLNPQPSGLSRVTVIDAGIAARIETGSVFDVMGTPEYVSPEQAKGKLVSFRSDLYSLGCMLHEMLTGAPPFQGTTAELLAAHVDKPAPTPQVALPAGVSTLLAQLLAKDPRERPFSAQQVRRALEPFLPEDASSVREATQTFEKMGEQRRAPAAGSGTLRPPEKSTIHGMPAQVPPPPRATSKPPPPPPAAKPKADGTEELSALDIEEAEQALASTGEVAKAGPANRSNGRAAYAATVPAFEQAPTPWQQTPLSDEGLDYDDLAETKAVDREQHSPAPVAPVAAPTPAPTAAPSEAPVAARPVVPATPVKKKSKLVPILLVLGLSGACVVFGGIAAAGGAWFWMSEEGGDALAAGPSIAWPSEDPLAQPAPLPVPVPSVVAQPEPQPAPVVVAQPEPVAAQPEPQPEPVVAQPEPQPEPVVAQPEPQPEPVVAQREPAPQAEPRARREPAQAREPSPRAEREPRQRAEEAPRESDFDRVRAEALAHFQARRFPQAAAAYQQATQLNPRHAGSFAGLGASRLALGQHGQAVAAYQRAVELSPRNPGYYAALGRAYLASGDRNRASQAFTRALSLDPNNASARQGISQL